MATNAPAAVIASSIALYAVEIWGTSTQYYTPCNATQAWCPVTPVPISGEMASTIVVITTSVQAASAPSDPTAISDVITESTSSESYLLGFSTFSIGLATSSRSFLTQASTSKATTSLSTATPSIQACRKVPASVEGGAAVGGLVLAVGVGLLMWAVKRYLFSRRSNARFKNAGPIDAAEGFSGRTKPALEIGGMHEMQESVRHPQQLIFTPC